MPPALNIAGKRFGRLLVISRAQIERARNVMWHCKCDCGNMTIAAASNIGRTTLSCGCLAKETAAELLRTARYQLTHGMSKSPEYIVWAGMHQRCYNPKHHKYARYGGRGIIICDRWRDNFMDFYADMGPRPSLKHSVEREDNNGNYEPSNCIWATMPVQARNTTTNNFISINGITLCVVDWCKVIGVPKWKPYEMTRGRGKDRLSPSMCESVEAAVRLLYAKSQ